AQLMETVHERCEVGLTIRTVRSGIHKGANAPHALGLLRARRERPRNCYAAEQRHELAPVTHSITSSARPSSVGGMVRPIALAVVKLMASSNLVGCSTEISPGFAPRKILSTNSAARRNWASMLGP